MNFMAEADYINENARCSIAPDNMASITVLPGDEKISLKFTLPSNTVIDGQNIVSVAGCRVNIKEGSSIANENDGTIVADLTLSEAQAYENTYMDIENLTNGTEYTIQIFPKNDQNMYNRDSANARTAVPQEYILLGYRINKADSNPATRVEYLEMAAGLTPAKMNYTTGQFEYGGFSNFWFITDNKPYMVKYDGTVDYQLDPNDYSKKADGTASDVSNTSYGGNAMAKIPLVWLYQYEESGYEYCYICNIQLNSNFKAYAHTRSNGSIMEYKWLSCFESGLVSGKARSIKGLTPMNTQTGTNEISYSTANGSLWYTRAWCDRNLINALLTLISKSDNSQASFGNGHYTGGSSASSLIATGTIYNKGQFYGTNGTGVAVKVFHLENWWGNIWERIAGCMHVGGKIKIKPYPTYNTSGDGYIDTNVSMSGTSGGYISTTKMTEYGRLPVVMAGSDSTYTCDGGWYNASQTDYALAGGCCYYGLLVGASCLYLASLVSSSYWNFGAALSCEQPVA